VSYYSNGGNGGTANNGTISIGGGGGGSGWDKVGGVGGNAAGGIYNASTGTLKIVGTSVISNNIGAGGGGGGGSGQGSNNLNGGDGGRGVGAIWNQGGTVLITASNFSAISGNAAGSGSGGSELGGGVTGSVPLAFAAIYNNGGTLNTAYVEPPTATIVMSDTALKIGETSLVTITFSEAVSGFDLSDISVANGALSNLTSSDGGVTWTATLTPTAGINDATNLIVLDTAGVQDLAGNAGASIAISNNYILDATRPTVNIVVANPHLGIGQTTTVTFTFSEAVSNFDLSDLSVTNGDLSNLSSSDGGKTWTATLTPNANVNSASNAISVNSAGVSDLSGNSGSGISQSGNYVINTVPVSVPPATPTSPLVVVSPDPEFRIDVPVVAPLTPNVPLQPIIFAPPTGNLGSPLTFPPLFEQRVIGNGIRPLGDIFINHGALSPSFIAQVFTSSDSGGDGSGHGFLGFGGGDGGVFGISTLSSLFNQDSAAERDSLNAFDSHSIRGDDVSQGLRGVFGAPTLGQQLQEIKDSEQHRVDNLAAALQQVGISEMPA